MLQAEQWLQWWSHGRCVHILQDEGHRLSEQQFVDCSKRSSGCNGGLTDAASTLFKMKAIASMSSSSSFASSGAVVALVVPSTLAAGAAAPAAAAIAARMHNFRSNCRVRDTVVHRTGGAPNRCPCFFNSGILTKGQCSQTTDVVCCVWLVSSVTSRSALWVALSMQTHTDSCSVLCPNLIRVVLFSWLRVIYMAEFFLCAHARPCAPTLPSGWLCRVSSQPGIHNLIIPRNSLDFIGFI